MARARWSPVNLLAGLPPEERRRADRATACGVEIEHAERFVPALHRHADDLADAVADDALHGLKALVAGRVGHEQPLLLAQHVIHDRAADGDLFLAVDAIAPAQRLGLKLGAIQHGRSGRCLAHRRLAQHDAAAVGVEGAKDQLQDALEELIEVEDVADGLGRLVRCRLARAFFSHGPSTSSGWARMRLPSVSPMVLTMADGRSRS